MSTSCAHRDPILISQPTSSHSRSACKESAASCTHNLFSRSSIAVPLCRCCTGSDPHRQTYCMNIAYYTFFSVDGCLAVGCTSCTPGAYMITLPVRAHCLPAALFAPLWPLRDDAPIVVPSEASASSTFMTSVRVISSLWQQSWH